MGSGILRPHYRAGWHRPHAVLRALTRRANVVLHATAEDEYEVHIDIGLRARTEQAGRQRGRR